MTRISNSGSKMGRHAFSAVASASSGIVTSVMLDAIVIAVFGMGRKSDAYFIANTIPMIIITILMLQATRVIQPIFINKREAQGESAGWNYLSLIITSGTVIVSVLSATGIFLSTLLVHVQAAGFPREEMEIATRLSVFCFSILPLYFPIVVMRAVLNSFGIFALPSAMKFFENAFKILFVLLLGRKLGLESLVLGMFAGALWQLSIFYFVLRRKGFRFETSLRLKHSDMIQAYRLIGFQLTGQTCAATVEVINNALGSMSGAGNVTALRLATRIIESIAGLLPDGIVVAAMPAIAATVASRDVGATKRHLQHGVHLLLLVTVPLSVWLGLISRPLIAFLYERASFSGANTILVGNLLLLMIPYPFLNRLWSLLELPFFAGQDTRTPLIASAAQAAGYVAVSLLLVSHLGIYALPIGRLLAGIGGPLFLAYLLRKRMGILGLWSVRNSARKICEASFIMAAFVLLGCWLTPAIPLKGFGDKVVALGLPSGAGLIANRDVTRHAPSARESVTMRTAA